jgi:hypothetical protein
MKTCTKSSCFIRSKFEQVYSVQGAPAAAALVACTCGGALAPRNFNAKKY